MIVGLPLRAQQQNPTPSKVWLSLSSATKVMYVRGFVDGALMARIRMMGALEDTTINKGWLKRGINKAASDSMFSILLREYTDPPGNAYSNVVAVMDQLYNDPANACIRFLAAYSAASRTLRGGTQSELAAFLASARAEGSHFCSF
jgi:hypothetical protein